MKKKKKIQSIEIKLLLKKNLKDVVDIEKKNNVVEDPDFGQMISEDAWTSIKFIDFIKRKNTFTYTISEGDLIVGFLLFEVRDKDVLIERISVDKNFRKSGFGTALLNFLYQKNYKQKIIYYCKEDDNETINFFKKNNYVGKLERNYFKVGVDAIKFSKEVL